MVLFKRGTKMNKKYILTEKTRTIVYQERRIVVHQIMAVRDFDAYAFYLGRAYVKHIKNGDLGGYIQSESSLSHDGVAWVDDNAVVFGGAIVCDDAWVGGNSKIYGRTVVRGYAKITDDADIGGTIVITDHAKVIGRSHMRGNLVIKDFAVIKQAGVVGYNVEVFGKTVIEYTTQFLKSNVANEYHTSKQISRK